MRYRRSHSARGTLLCASLGLIGTGCDAAAPTDTGSGSASSSGSSGTALTGQRVYLAERVSIDMGSVVPFDVAEDGSLARVAGAPFPVGTLTGKGLVHAEACRGFLFVATDAHGAAPESILGFQFADSGAPVFVSSTFASRVTHLACYEDRFLYAVSEGTSLLAFAVLPDGTLESTTGHTVVDPLSSPHRLQARGGHLFAFSEQDDELRVYGIDEASGALSHPPVGPSWPQKHWMSFGAASPDGRWFASTTGGIGISISSVGADGTLTLPPTKIVDPADSLLERVAWVGTQLVVSSHSTTLIRSYDFSANGAVTLPAVSVLDLGPSSIVQDMVIDAQRSRAFLLMAANDPPDAPPVFSIVVLDVSASGEVTLAPGSPVPVGGGLSAPLLLLR